MALLIEETLKKGLKAGLFVAITPIITDGPLVAIAIIFARSIRILPDFLGTLSIAGGCFLIFLGIQSIRGAKNLRQTDTEAPATLGKAIIVNLLNPYPYIFWLSVATPIFAKGDLQGSIVFACSLLGTVTLVLSLIALAVSVVREKFLRVIPYLIRILGCILIFFAIFFIRQGLLFFIQ